MATTQVETNGSSRQHDIETRLFINNEFVKSKSGKTIPVINPATEHVSAEVEEASEAEVESAVLAAEAAFPAWSEISGFQRATYFYKLADLYEQNNDNLARLEAISMGRPISTYSMAFISGCDAGSLTWNS